MAWIMKPSATMTVERREEPYLTSKMRKQLEEVYLPRYPRKQAATIPALHLVQDEYNSVPWQAVEEIAEFLELSPAQVYDTATFYDEFTDEPVGENLIMVCQSLSCELCGQVDLLEKISHKLGIGPGETTDDGKFTLKTCECLGSCGTAPAALVNQKLHEDMTFDAFAKTLDALD